MGLWSRSAPTEDIDEDRLQVHPPKTYAAGLKAVTVALERGIARAGAVRIAKSLLRLNQRGGFDCPGCAWPESDGKRKAAEFCENGAKAVAEENTLRTAGPSFWAKHSINELSDKTEYWLGSQGRITEPTARRRPGQGMIQVWAGVAPDVCVHARRHLANRCRDRDGC